MRTLALFVTLVAIGCGKPVQDDCAAAADHVATCLGTTEAASSCDPSTASDVLGQTCDQLSASSAGAKADGGLFSRTMCRVGFGSYCTWTFRASFHDGHGTALFDLGVQLTRPLSPYPELAAMFTDANGSASLEDRHEEWYEVDAQVTSLQPGAYYAGALPCGLVNSPGVFETLSRSYVVELDANRKVIACAPEQTAN